MILTNRLLLLFLTLTALLSGYPMQARKEVIAKYGQRGGIKDPVYAAMIADKLDMASGKRCATAGQSDGEVTKQQDQP